MNVKNIQQALDQIEENFDDAGVVGNAVQIIRMEVGKGTVPALDPEKFFGQKFEPGGNYMVFVEAGAVEPATLMSSGPADYGLMFVFVHPDGQPVADKFLVCERGQRILADSRYVETMAGVEVVDTGGAELRDVIGVKE